MTNQPAQQAETQDVITPYAFAIPDALMGLPLAKPWKRATAMLVDLTLVVLLSYLHVVFLALAFSVMFFRMGRGVGKGIISTTLRTTIKLGAALAIFVSSLYLLSLGMQGLGIWRSHDDDSTGMVYVKLIPAIISAESCTSLFCWDSYLDNIVAGIAAAEPVREDAVETLMELADDSNLSAEDKVTLKQRLLQRYKESVGVDTQLPDRDSTIQEAGESVTGTESAVGELTAELSDTTKEEGDKHDVVIRLGDDPEESKYRITAWIKGLIEELGLGFGWAAIYFSVLTTWWQGRTVGKRLLKIRVLQLNNAPVTLWSAFERYGGYSAGLATGLLGFLQVFWDPNRQAIHDKISATVVIDDV